jgi:hypothetical protein
MSCDAVRERRGRVLTVAAILSLLLVSAVAGASLTEDELFRQVKVDVFDQAWHQVLRGCEEILERYPSGATASQAAFYRARALTRIPGRETEGVKAFKEFVAAHPRDRVMVEQAWAALISSACESRKVPGPDCRVLLREGLESRSGYVATLAAIRVSDTTDADLRRLALATLKRAYDTQTDSEIRNQILIAILKIDPKQVPPTDAPGPPSPPETRRPASKGAPSLIRMTIYDKVEKRYELKVNLPVAFARMLIEAMGDDQRLEMQREARQKGIDLDDIFEAIEKSGAGKLLEVDGETSHIEIWIE